MRFRWRIVGPIALVCTAAVWWVASTASTPPAPLDPVAQASAGAPAPGDAAPAASPGRAPYSKAGLDDRQARLALWQQRLQRAQETLESYRTATRYPFDSRPASEHLDQWQPHQVVTTDTPLRMPGTGVVPNMHVHTTQQRVFATGADTVGFTVSVTDDNGASLPLKILSSVSHSPQDTGGGGKAAPLAPVVTQPFVDDGSLGDLQAGDGVYTGRLDPMAQGFGNFAGMIRTELIVQSGAQQGYVAFDVVYSPQVPATWTGSARDVMRDGSLDFVLGANVVQAGRYVITGRVDDASGKPLALVTFNDELRTGAQQVTLQVHGRLMRDAQARFPLTLHDVEGFLLRPDAYPDRAMMPSLDGPVATSRPYTLAQFSGAAFSSDETQRYLAEYGKDVAQAQQQVSQLQSPPPKP